MQEFLREFCKFVHIPVLEIGKQSHPVSRRSMQFASPIRKTLRNWLMETYVVHPDKSQEKALKAFLKALEVPFEIRKKASLPEHVISGIQKGQQDIEAGKSISLEEFKETIAAYK